MLAKAPQEKVIYNVLIYNVLTPTEKLLYLIFEHKSKEMSLLLFKELLNICRVDVLLTLFSRFNIIIRL